MIVVTGGSGVLGKALLKELADAGHPVEVVASRNLDLRDQEAVVAYFKAKQPEVVYHLAAKVHGLGGNQAFPAEMFTDNVRINTNVVDAARIAGCRKFVAISTVATYASDLPMPVNEDMIWDGPPHGSEAAYGHAKRAMLAQLQAVKAQYGMAFAYAIMTNIYGPHDRFDIVHGHVIPSLVAKFFKATQDGGDVAIWGSGIAERDFLYADDAARALLAIERQVEGPINVASGSVHAIREAVDILADHSGVDRIRWDSSKPDGQLLRRYDIGKLQATGFVPIFSLADGLKRTYDWYRNNFPNVRT